MDDDVDGWPELSQRCSTTLADDSSSIAPSLPISFSSQPADSSLLSYSYFARQPESKIYPPVTPQAPTTHSGTQIHSGLTHPTPPKPRNLSRKSTSRTLSDTNPQMIRTLLKQIEQQRDEHHQFISTTAENTHAKQQYIHELEEKVLLLQRQIAQATQEFGRHVTIANVNATSFLNTRPTSYCEPLLAFAPLLKILYEHLESHGRRFQYFLFFLRLLFV